MQGFKYELEHLKFCMFESGSIHLESDLQYKWYRMYNFKNCWRRICFPESD